MGKPEYVLVSQRKNGWRWGFFCQYAISFVIGTLAFHSLRTFIIHFDLRPPFSLVVVLMPAGFFLGMIFLELSGGIVTTILDVVAFFLNAMYYGAVVFIVWRMLMHLKNGTI